MIRSVLASVSFTVCVSTIALAQPLPPRLVATPISPTILLSLDAVQIQVDASLKLAAVSKTLIDGAVSAPLPALASTPFPRR